MLDPRWVARLTPLELRARIVAESAQAGVHESRRRGPTGDFLTHRPYAPGDEPSRIDWKALARSDRWMVREARQESRLEATLLLDASGSMGFSQGGRLDKVRYAAFLLSALAYVLVHRQDAAGLAIGGAGIGAYAAPRTGPDQLDRILTTLDQARAEGPTDIGRTLRELAARLRRRGMVIVASDFLPPPESWLKELRALTARGHEVVVFQILDPAELTLDFPGPCELRDLETGARLTVDVESVRPRYAAIMRQRQEALRRILSSARMDHVVFHTDDPVDAALARYLRLRERQ